MNFLNLLKITNIISFIKNRLNFITYGSLIIVLILGVIYHFIQEKKYLVKISKLNGKIAELNIDVKNCKTKYQALKNNCKIQDFEEKYKILKKCLKKENKEKNESKANIPNKPGYYTITIP